MRHILISAALMLWGSTLAAAGDPVVLLDQIGDPSHPRVINGFIASHRPATGSTLYDDGALDEFTVGDTPVTVCEVAAVMTLWNFEQDGIASYDIEVYSSPARAGEDLAGDVASVTVDVPDVATHLDLGWPGGTYPDYLLQFGVSIELEANTQYWIAVIPRYVFYDLCGVYRTPMGDQAEAYLAVPSGVWGYTYRLISEIVDNPEDGVGLAYRVLAGECAALCAPAATGDVNGDGWTDFTDLLLILANWTPAKQGGCGGPCEVLGDADCDGAIDMTDLLLVTAHWNPAP